MANFKTLGAALTIALGAAGLSSCIWDCRSMGCDGNHSGKRTEQRTSSSVRNNPSETDKPKSSQPVMPPLTQVDCLDTLVFNSKVDSIEYNKYCGIAYGNCSKIREKSVSERDSVINLAKKELEPKIQELETKSHAQYEKLMSKREKELEQAEKDYKDNKITFEQLEAKKEKIEKQLSDDYGKFVYPIEQKKDKLEKQIRQVEDRENSKQEKTDNEAHDKFLADQKVMREKYTKEVRKFGHPGPLEQDVFGWARVQYKSKDDSIKANKYIERQSKIYAPYEKKELELQKKIDQLQAQIDKLYEQDKYEQAEKLSAQQEKLFEQLDKAQENSFDNRVVPDSIAKYTKKHPFKLDTDSTKTRYYLSEPN